MSFKTVGTSYLILYLKRRKRKQEKVVVRQATITSSFKIECPGHMSEIMEAFLIHCYADVQNIYIWSIEQKEIIVEPDIGTT